MYGDEAVKLVRELKRFPDTLPPHNTDTVYAVQRELRHLYLHTQAYITKLKERHEQELAERRDAGEDTEDTAGPTLTLSDEGMLAVSSVAIARNKRCLLTYHHHRAQRIMKMVWSGRAEGAGQIGAPQELRENLSAQEQSLYKNYARLLHAYKSNYLPTLDITGSLQPPRSNHITVRAVRDVEFMTEGGVVKRMARGEMEMVVRSDVVERFVEKGFLLHVTSASVGGVV